MDPTWNPDGASIVFRHSEAGVEVVSRVDAAGGASTPLSDPDASLPQFTLSPDGSKIAFDTERDGNSEIYVMDANGFNETNITNDPSSDTAPTWSPDGTRIAFRSNRDGTTDIWTMDPDGGSPTNLNAVSGTQSVQKFRWFPDGSRIAYDRVIGQDASIRVVNGDGTGQHPVVDIAGQVNAGPIVSPDGSRIAFIRIEDLASPDFEVWIANADGSNQLRITNSSDIDDEPSWPPCP